MNVVTPHHSATVHHGKKHPVFAWIHGGSLLYGSSNYGAYDTVNLVSHSVAIGLPIVVVSFNYRLGLGGFLASSKIAKELKQDGFSGNGNFGFTDQAVALDWVQKYIGQFGGDLNNVTVVGQSAGAVSIGHHLAANHPMKFHRAVCMSGLGSTLRTLSMEEHEALFNATCRYFSIDAQASDALDLLRKVDQQVLANADHIIQGVPSGTGNPCQDGWFYAHDPQEVTEAPHWLRSFMIGDVHNEGVIFVLNLWNNTYDTVRSTLLEHIQDEKFLDSVFNEYGVTSELPKSEFIEKVCNMGADAVFKIQNFETALVNKRLREEGHALFKYHFDQRSRLDNILNGKAYHGFDVIYLFGNLDSKLNKEERQMAHDFASAWINFTYGQAPWQRDDRISYWKLWGPNCQQKVVTKEADEFAHCFSRFERLLALGTGGLWQKYVAALDYLVMKRGNLGKFESKAV